MRLAAEAMLGARTVVLCGHVNADGDSAGSVLGLALALRAAGIDAIPTSADPEGGPRAYSFLPGFDLFRPAAGLAAPDVFVAMDAPNASRLGEAENLAHEAGTLVVLDHHPDSACFGHINVVDWRAAAVGQIVWRLLPALGVAPTRDIAQCLYVAVMTDTGRFSYGNTDSSALRDAAAMVDAGADPHATYEAVYERRSAGFLRLLGVVLSRVTHANGDKVAYSWYEPQDLVVTGARMDETEDLVDFVRTVGDVDVVFLLKAGEGDCRVSLRAKDSFDVGSVARSLGGGGHAAAAGASCPGGIDEALEAILPQLPGGIPS